ncbi:MAG: glycoside hydrolase family 28 protein [Pirellulales bacterium]
MFEFKKARLLGWTTAIVLCCGAAAAQTLPAAGVWSVRDSGAVGNGTQLDTQAIQKAIDACARAGGGTVHFPAGRYLSGTLFLKSLVTLHLDAGATLLGSPKLSDYPVTVPAVRSYTDHYTVRSLIYGANLERIAIEGRGVIDGQGAAFHGEYKVRPYLIRLIGCRDVAVRDITLVDSPMWVQHYLACDGILIDGIRVASTCNGNNDGIDIDGCQRVRIAKCDIRSGDDAIVLKSTLDRPCRDVAVTNCVLSSLCNAFKLGTESNGGFQDITLSNCTIYDTHLAGIALELVDGGTLERVNVSNVTMRNARGVIFVRLGNRARPFKPGMAPPGVGRLRQVRISNVQADGADGVGCSITGLADHPVEDVALENISITFRGGGDPERVSREVPELADAYPEYSMFGTLPAYGFYCRHVRGLELSRVRVSVAQPDARPSLVCHDVSALEIFAWRSAATAKADPVVLFRDVQDALVHGCRAPRGTGTFLAVEGPQSGKIKLVANDLTEASRPVATGAGAPPDAAK